MKKKAKKQISQNTLLFGIGFIFIFFIIWLLIITQNNLITTKSTSSQAKVKQARESKKLTMQSIENNDLYYKDQPINERPAPSGKQSPIPDIITIKRIYFQKDIFSPTNREEITNQIKQSWGQVNINKYVDVSQATEIVFDPTQKTNCFIKARRNDHDDVYFPEDYCISDDYQIAFTNVVFLFNRGLASNYGKRIWIETSLSYIQSRVLKHELGHMFGAPDLDFVNVSGNSFFRNGNKNIINDVMANNDSEEVSEYTREIINRTHKNDDSEISAIRVGSIKLSPPRPRIFPNSVTEKELLQGEFTLFGGAQGKNHENGTTYEEPVCVGKLNTDLIIDLDSCFFKRYPYIAGFVLIKTKSTTLKGQFDMINLALSLFHKEPYHTVELSY